MRYQRLLAAYLILCTVCGALSAATYTVNSASQVHSLISGGTLAAGDTIVWSNGSYSNQNIEFEGLNGTSSNPITLKAETPGGVKFTGSSQLNISGSWLVIDGFFWDGGTGSSDHVEFRADGSSTAFATNCVIRNCAFDDLATSGDDKSRWIVFYGQNNTVENCSFLNKHSTGAGILVELRYNGQSQTAGHIIQNNYFYNFPSKDGRTNANDSEGIRIGVSTNQAWDSSTTVRNNYFKAVSGENEIISNKSANNFYLDNTFRLCRGSLVLRHGANAWVEGNYFIGDGTVNSSGGIRISDSDHTVINNYMQDLKNDSDNWNAGIVIVSGDQTSGGSSNGYQEVDNVVVAFNTIYDSTKSIHFNDRTSNDPTNVTIANNLAYSSHGDDMIQGDGSVDTSGVTWSGNIFNGSPLGYSSSGISTSDPQFSFSNGLYRPSSSGPAADAATGSYSYVALDVEGQSRPSSSKDVGADEVSGATGSQLLPYQDSHVGSVVGACYLDASGSSISCSGGGSNPPAQVTGLNATAGDGEVDLAWNSTTGATTYNVKRSTSSGGSYSTIQSGLTGTSYTDGTVSNGTTYYYVVSASNSNGEGSNSSQASATPQSSGSGSLTQLCVFAVDASSDDGNVPANTIDGSLSTRWSAQGDGSWIRYELEASGTVEEVDIAWHQGDQRVFTFEIETSTNGTSWTQVFSGSSSGNTLNLETYNVTDTTASWVRIVGYGNTVNDWNSILETEIWGSGGCDSGTPPDQVTGLNATAGDGEVDLTWNSATGATTYNVKRSTSSGGSYSTIQSGLTGTSYTDGTVSNGTTYYYVVSASNSNGEGQNSSQASATPQSSGSGSLTQLCVFAVDASSDDGNVPANTIDGSLSTRWSAQGDGSWIRYELEASGTVEEVDIAWHQGDERVFTFEIETSTNGTSWTQVFSGSSSGNTLNLETYDVTDTTASWVRIVGYGNTVNNWNSILETEIWGSGGCGSGGGSQVVIDFDTTSTTAYGSVGPQDGSGTVQAQDSGATLFISGNRWRDVPVNYTVTASTVLEFDFRSTDEAEMHVIGLDDDDNQDNTLRGFQLHGTQNWSNTYNDHYDYSGTSWKSYSIAIGQFYTGTFDRIFFVNDGDSDTGNGYFRNVTLREN